MGLTEEQIEFVRQEIAKGAIRITSLKEDLLDHFCCYIENEMKMGRSFKEAFEIAYKSIAPNGFNEIERETIFLLNFKKIVIMKKLMYFVGLLSSISVSLGLLFKILDWTGANNLFAFGFLGFVLVFIPLLTFDQYKLNLQKKLTEKMRRLLGLASAIITGFSILFKIMHFQGADILLVVGAGLFSFGYLPFLFFNLYKKSLQ